MYKINQKVFLRCGLCVDNALCQILKICDLGNLILLVPKSQGGVHWDFWRVKINGLEVSRRTLASTSQQLQFNTLHVSTDSVSPVPF